MFAVPATTPVTTPVTKSIDAVEGSSEVQLPPGIAPPVACNVEDVPGHTANVPVITPELGDGLTVTIFVAAAVPQLLVTV